MLLRKVTSVPLSRAKPEREETKIRDCISDEMQSLVLESVSKFG